MNLNEFKQLLKWFSEDGMIAIESLRQRQLGGTLTIAKTLDLRPKFTTCIHVWMDD